MGIRSPILYLHQGKEFCLLVLQQNPVAVGEKKGIISHKLDGLGLSAERRIENGCLWSPIPFPWYGR